MTAGGRREAHALVTLGEAGVLHASARATAAAPGRRRGGCARARRLLPAAPVERVVDCTGAGDTLVAGAVAAHCAGWPMAECVRFGMRAAECTLQRRAVAAPRAPRSTARISAARRRP